MKCNFIQLTAFFWSFSTQLYVSKEYLKLKQDMKKF